MKEQILFMCLKEVKGQKLVLSGQLGNQPIYEAMLMGIGMIIYFHYRNINFFLMPNGGSDCCGTCDFNRKGPEKYGATFCTIRQLNIPDPFWTYCVNHPTHNKRNITIPLGPVYITDSYPYTRKVWLKPSYTDNREDVVKLLDQICLQFEEEERIKWYWYEKEVIKQLMDSMELKAIPSLLRMTHQYSLIKKKLKYDSIIVYALAVEALLVIGGSNYVQSVEPLIKFGMDEYQEYSEAIDEFSPIRYHVVLGLKNCVSIESLKLLEIAMKDKHSQVSAFAQEVYMKVQSKLYA